MSSSTGGSGQSLRRADRQARRLMPADGDLEQLLVNVGQHRGRPLTVLDGDLGQDGPSGMWIETETADYVVIDSASSPARRAAAICHEIAHMLLGHRGRQLGDELQAVFSHVRPTLAGRFLARHGYDEPDEVAAETLATRLVAEHGRRDRAAQLNRDVIAARLR